MFLSDFASFIKGYLTISVSGRFPERFFNVCATRNILLWNIETVEEDEKTYIKCNISIRAFKSLTKIAHKTGVSISILEKKGLFVLLSKYKRRKWLIIGPALFIIFISVFNMFIWDIEINGCKNVDENKILAELAANGVKIGTPRFLINEKKIKNEMLIRMPELSWIWTDKSGSRLVVSVRESVPKPEIINANDYSNMVATKDGIISSLIVKNGTPMFAEGDTVQKDDILVSGLMISERNVAPQYIRADAKVYASVWYEETENFALCEEVKKETGRKSKVRKFKIFGKSFTPFWYDKQNFNYFDMETKIFEPTFFGRYLGITIETEICREYIPEKVELTEESVVNNAVITLTEKIDANSASDAQKKEISHSFEKKDDGTIAVTVVAEYVENIAKRVKVEK